MIKFIKYTFYTFFALFLGVMVFIQTDYAKTQATQYIKEFFHQNTGYTIEFEDVSLFPPFSFSAKEVNLSDNNNTILTINSLQLKISPFDLKEGSILLHSLVLDGVEITTPSENKIDSSDRSWKDLPMNLEIESFKVHHLKTSFKGLNTYDDPISFEGNLYVQPNIEHIIVNSRFWQDSQPREILQTSLEFIKNQGSFRIDASSTAKIEGKFKLEDDNSIALSDLKGTSGPLHAGGNIHIDENWNILSSSLTISSSDIAKASPLQGTFSGQISLTGKILKPEINATFSSDKIQWGSHSFENILISIASNKKMSLEFTKEGHPYKFDSLLEWEIPLSPKAVATVDIADILQLFRIENSNISGQLTCGIDFSQGTTFGNIAIKNMAYESYELGCSFKDIEALVSIEKDRIVVNQFKGKDIYNGQFFGTGEMKLLLDENLPFELRFNIENTEVLHLDFFNAAVTGNGVFKGNSNGAILEGNVVTNYMNFTLPEKSKTSRKSVAITYVNQPADEIAPTEYVKNRLKWPLELNIEVKTGEDAVVDGKGLQSEWKGKAKITGTADAFLVNGEMHLKEGSYQFRGKNLNLKSGSVNFQGDIEKDTTLYVIAEIELDQITAEVIVKGSTSNPAISFRSTPPLPQREILSWILFNKGFSEISEFQGTQLNESITDLIESADTGPDLLTRIQNSLGVDRIDFSGSRDSEGMSIHVGKYISKKTFLTLSHNAGSSSDTNSSGDTHTVGIETHLKKNFRFQAEMGDDGNGQANIIWKKNY